jgi:hypothetical protein
MVGFLGKRNIKHRKIVCRFEPDIPPDTRQSDVDFNSTLDR